MKSPPGISLASLPKHWFLASLWLQRKPKEHVRLLSLASLGILAPLSHWLHYGIEAAEDGRERLREGSRLG